MKSFIFLLLTFTSDATETFDLPKIRKLFSESLTNELKAKELISYIDNLNFPTIASGYKGAATMLLAKYALNPYKKYKYFNEGKNLLEAAILKDPASSELRYLRFMFQSNVPSFLGYKSSIGEDKQFLIDAIGDTSDNNLRNIITNILKNSDYVDDHVKQKL